MKQIFTLILLLSTTIVFTQNNLIDGKTQIAGFQDLLDSIDVHRLDITTLSNSNQSLSISSNDLTISNSNTVTLNALSAAISNDNTTLNFNATTGFFARILATTEYNDFTTEVTINNNGFTVNKAGTYSISVGGYVTATGARSTTIFRIQVGTRAYYIDSITIRNANNINEMSFSGTITIKANAGDNIVFQSRREGSRTQAVTPVGIGDVYMSIVQLK